MGRSGASVGPQSRGMVVFIPTLCMLAGVQMGCLVLHFILAEYLLGGGQMGCLVLGFSLMASFFNAVFLLGAPAETYYFGTVWHLTAPPYILTCILNSIFIVPFFRRSSSTSGYEYLEKRYKSKIPRLAGAFGFSIHMLSFLALVMYAPALAFNQVSGLNMNIAIASCGVICTLYTFLGGLRAVLWADAAQTLLILFSFVVMCALGIDRVGGWVQFTDRVQHGARLNYLKAYMINTAASCSLALLTSFMGLVLYAYYADCDPMVAGITSKPDQLLPHFVLEVLGAYPGLPGCFIAAIFAAALSTVSSIVNSLSLVSLEDLVKPLHRAVRGTALPEHSTLLVTKALTAMYGLISIALAFVAPHMGPVLLQIPVMLHSCIGAPMNVLFAVSIFWPYANLWGATLGSLLGLGFGLFLALAKMFHGTKPTPLPLGQCVNDINSTTSNMISTLTTDLLHVSTTPIPQNPRMFEYFGEMSYMWYPVLTWMVTLSACILISAIAKLARLPKTENTHIYKEGLVYYSYAGNSDSDYKDVSSNSVVLKHFIDKEPSSK